MEKIISRIVGLIAVTAMIVLTAAGCVVAPATQAAGTMVLSVNPEIEIEYDSNGQVLRLEGLNDDGRAVVESVAFAGRSCYDVAGELISKIYELGYFTDDIDEIRINLAQGSQLPSDQFIAELRNAIKAAAQAHGVASGITALNQPADTNGMITLDEAKQIAVAHAGVANPRFTDCELDDGKYEIEFVADGIEYDYDIDAFTGAVLKSSAKTWHDDDIPLPSELIGMDRAKEIAVAHAGVTNPVFDDCELDDHKYEIEFYANGIEYDYDIHATTGAVLSYSSELIDDDDDDDYVPSPGNDTLIGFDRAKEIAVAHAGVTNPVFGDCELDDGKYEIEFFANGVEYDYDIHAFTGAVLSYSSELIDDDDDDYIPSPGNDTLIGFDRAKEIAVAHAGVTNPVFGDCELDDGKYEIEFFANGVEYDYDIHAFTGAVLSYSSEPIDDDDDDDDDDYVPSPGNDTLIGFDRAKEIAVAHAGVTNP
ncbi:MAG: PepSY domain-containing protein, partial [Clostridia bacterium]|nr:PepSY domain-containing protein [Clostridia bacterium]